MITVVRKRNRIHKRFLDSYNSKLKPKVFHKSRRFRNNDLKELIQMTLADLPTGELQKACEQADYDFCRMYAK
jgi:hypothetical protein